MMAVLAPSRRVRRTPFSAAVEAAGVTAYSVYNRMLLPTMFEGPTQDYHHLKRHVQLWDVSCERQVSIKGPSANSLMTLLSPRDLSRMKADQCYYIPVVDRFGGLLNDPVTVKLAEDHYWISVADGDYLQYVLGVADALGLDVEVEEPDVSPLAVQGPKANALMARIFGEAVHEIGFFRHKRLPFLDTSFVVARSGYSRQGGFEIYVEGQDYAMPLWQALMAAGEDLEVRAGCPNLIERIEGGLLSYGNDMTRANTPYEAGLGKFVNSPDSFFGKAALAERPYTRAIRPVEIEGDLPPCDRDWPVYAEGSRVGQVTSAAMSPDFGTGVSIAMIDQNHWTPGTLVEVETQVGMHRAWVRDRFWA